MIAGIAQLLGPEREYVLCDSFEGLPPAQLIDGHAALAWQQDTTSEVNCDNCSSPEGNAREAMALSGAKKTQFVAGWFSDTLPKLDLCEPIALLRLDGDWYDSTMTCLTSLFGHVAQGGIVIIDDYHTWDGCSRAVHDFLAHHGSSLRIRQWSNDVCYIRIPKNDSGS